MRTIVPVSAKQTAGLTICASSSIPPNWVVTGEYYLTDRPAATTICQQDAATAVAAWNNAFVQKTIQQVTSATMQVCADSPLPKGFQITQYSIYVATCRGDQGTSNLIAPLSSVKK